MLSGTSSNGAPQNLEQLLERQWEQGSQFLMEQAQHFDSEFFINLQFGILPRAFKKKDFRNVLSCFSIFIMVKFLTVAPIKYF